MICNKLCFLFIFPPHLLSNDLLWNTAYIYIYIYTHTLHVYCIYAYTRHMMHTDLRFESLRKIILVNTFWKFTTDQLLLTLCSNQKQSTKLKFGRRYPQADANNLCKTLPKIVTPSLFWLNGIFFEHSTQLQIIFSLFA